MFFNFILPSALFMFAFYLILMNSKKTNLIEKKIDLMDSDLKEHIKITEKNSIELLNKTKEAEERMIRHADNGYENIRQLLIANNILKEELK